MIALDVQTGIPVFNSFPASANLGLFLLMPASQFELWCENPPHLLPPMLSTCRGRDRHTVTRHRSNSSACGNWYSFTGGATLKICNIRASGLSSKIIMSPWPWTTAGHFTLSSPRHTSRTLYCCSVGLHNILQSVCLCLDMRSELACPTSNFGV